MRSKEEWLYPHHITPALSDARGEPWQELTQYIATLDEEHEDSLAFSLLMIELCGCATCQPRGYRLSLGCRTCALRAAANAKSGDAHILRRYQAAQEQVRTFLAARTPCA